MSISNRLGIHLIGDNFDPTRLGRPAVVKLVNPSVAFKARVRTQVGQDALIVIRFYEPEQPLDVPWLRAREWWMRRAGQIAALSDAQTVFEGYNEIADEQAASYAAFESYRLEFLHAAGLRTCVGNWSVGVPDLPVWAAYAPMLAATRATDVVGLHEYWPDPPGLADPWLCGRWQMVPELASKNIVITECGRDRVLGRGQPGWKLTTNAEAYIAELRQYAILMDSNPNVIGSVVFTGGHADGWENFDVGEIWNRVVAEQEPPGGATVEVPDLAIACILATRNQLAVTADAAWHLAHGEDIAVDVAPLAGVGDLALVTPWPGLVEFVGDDPAGRGYHCGIVDVDHVYDMRAFGEMQPWPNGSYDSWLEVGLTHVQAPIPFRERDVVESGTLVGLMGWTGLVLPPGAAGRHLHTIVWLNASGDLSFRHWRRIDPAKLVRLWGAA